MQKKCENGVLDLHLQLHINRTGQNSLVYMELVALIRFGISSLRKDILFRLSMSSFLDSL